MQLLANDTVLFDGTEQECVDKLSEMIRGVIYNPENKTVRMIEHDSTHAIVNHSEFGQVLWHIEPTPNGGVFDTSSDTDSF